MTTLVLTAALTAVLAVCAGAQDGGWEAAIRETAQAARKTMIATRQRSGDKKPPAPAPARVQCRPSIGECRASCNPDAKIRCVQDDPACPGPRDRVGTYCEYRPPKPLKTPRLAGNDCRLLSQGAEADLWYCQQHGSSSMYRCYADVRYR